MTRFDDNGAQSGNVLWKILSLRVKVVSFDHPTGFSGSGPVKEFPWRLSSANCEDAEDHTGIVPLSPHWEITSDVRSGICPHADGNVEPPTKVTNTNEMEVMAGREPQDEGSGPVMVTLLLMMTAFRLNRDDQLDGRVLLNDPEKIEMDVMEVMEPQDEGSEVIRRLTREMVLNFGKFAPVQLGSVNDNVLNTTEVMLVIDVQPNVLSTSSTVPPTTVADCRLVHPERSGIAE